MSRGGLSNFPALPGGLDTIDGKDVAKGAPKDSRARGPGDIDTAASGICNRPA